MKEGSWLLVPGLCRGLLDLLECRVCWEGGTISTPLPQRLQGRLDLRVFPLEPALGNPQAQLAIVLWVWSVWWVGMSDELALRSRKPQMMWVEREEREYQEDFQV